MGIANNIFDMIKSYKTNYDDMKTLFGVCCPTEIMLKAISIDELIKLNDDVIQYFSWVLPVNNGDIIKINNSVYTVVCTYTDNTIDVVNLSGIHDNIGIYKNNIEIIGKLDMMEEQEIW